MAYENELIQEPVNEGQEPATQADEVVEEIVNEDVAIEAATEETPEVTETTLDAPVEVLETAETGLPEADPEILAEDSVDLTAELYDDDLLSDAALEELEIDFDFEGEPKKPNVIAEKVQEVKAGVQEKYDEARTACKSVMERLTKDLEETNYNPYIRSTTHYKYEILRSSSDTEPVDVFEFERTSGYSLRAMAITSALVLAADIAVTKLLKKKL